MSSDSLSHDEAIVQFCGVTGADEDRAKGLLEACDWNLELAINMHVETDDRPRASNSSAGPSEPSIPLITIPAEETSDGSSTQSSSRAFNGLYEPEHVRPPIPPIRQVLVQHPAPYSRPTARRGNIGPPTRNSSDVYDAFRDFQAEAQWQEMVQEGESSASESLATSQAGRRTLQELFRPPLEIMFRGSLISAREMGTLQNKWLLVNIQDGREFACQILNRDVWSNQTVKDIMKEYFIFWQVYHDSFEGGRYTQFYNVKSFPHVSIIDPRTGEQMKSWPTSIDHNTFCDSVIEFLTEHPSPDGSTDANTMKKLRLKGEDPAGTLYDQSEEAQLEAAIKASLQESENSNSSKAFADEDSCTDAIESDTDQTISSKPSINERQALRAEEERKQEIEDEKRRRIDGQKIAETKFQEQERIHLAQQIRKEALETQRKCEIEQMARDHEAMKMKNNSSSEQLTSDDAPACRIALRFPDNTSLVRKFSPQAQLSAVKLFVQMEKGSVDDSIEFIAPPNRKLTESMMSETLESLGLCPASRLEVRKQ